MEDRDYILEKLAATVGGLRKVLESVKDKERLLGLGEAAFKTGKADEIAKLITTLGGGTSREKAYARILQGKLSKLTGVSGTANTAAAEAGVKTLNVTKGSEAEKTIGDFATGLRENIKSKQGGKLQPYVTAAKDGTLVNSSELTDKAAVDKVLGGSSDVHKTRKREEALKKMQIGTKVGKTEIDNIAGVLKGVNAKKKDAMSMLKNLKNNVYGQKPTAPAPQVTQVAAGTPKVDAPEAGFNDEMKNAWEGYKKKWKEKPWAMGAGHAAVGGGGLFLATRGGNEQV